MTQKIVFGGGCFWCTEAVMQQLRGVVSVRSGYAGGDKDVSSYRIVSTGTTGHAEVVEVEYDPEVIPFSILLDAFFTSHDPTSLDRQGNDIGPQYRSCIFFTTDEQEQEIVSKIKSLDAEGVYNKPIVTKVKNLYEFFPAEDLHQNYYNNNRSKPYCATIIDPKVKKIRDHFKSYLKEE
ncbi:MAG: peptide-methionine (S)-S-oxide reductase MsrA [Patescibacteria group bacterium]